MPSNNINRNAIMLKLSIRRLVALSASILCALLLLGNLIVWNSNASLAAAAEEASRVEQSIRALSLIHI